MSMMFALGSHQKLMIVLALVIICVFSSDTNVVSALEQMPDSIATHRRLLDDFVPIPNDRHIQATKARTIIPTSSSSSWQLVPRGGGALSTIYRMLIKNPLFILRTWHSYFVV